MANLKHDVGLPDAIWPTPAGLRLVALAALFAYAFLKFLWPEVGDAAGTLMAILGLLSVLALGVSVRSSAPLWFLLTAIFAQIISWTGGYFHHPDWISDVPQLDRLAKLFMFVGVAWWMGGNTRLVLLGWGLGALGVVLVMLPPFTSWAIWERGLAGLRVGLSVQNAQHDSMLLGTVLIGLIIMAKRFIGPGPWRFCRTAVWLLGLLVCLAGVMVTQTRATWLGLPLALAIAGIFWALHERANGHPGAAKRMFALLGGAVLILSLVMGAFHEVIEKRIGQEQQIIAQIIDGELEALPNSSVGVRIHSWRAAGEWISERPLIGWGGQGRGLVMDHTEWLPPLYAKRFGHLHNSFLELWVSYGLLGLLIFFALAIWVGIGTFRAFLGGVMPGDIALFSVSFFVFWIVVNQFESFMGFGSGVYVFNMVLGGMVTHIWRWQVESGQRIFPNPLRKAA